MSSRAGSCSAKNTLHHSRSSSSTVSVSSDEEFDSECSDVSDSEAPGVDVDKIFDDFREETDAIVLKSLQMRAKTLARPSIKLSNAKQDLLVPRPEKASEKAKSNPIGTSESGPALARKLKESLQDRRAFVQLQLDRNKNLDNREKLRREREDLDELFLLLDEIICIPGLTASLANTDDLLFPKLAEVTGALDLTECQALTLRLLFRARDLRCRGLESDLQRDHLEKELRDTRRELKRARREYGKRGESLLEENRKLNVLIEKMRTELDPLRKFYRKNKDFCSRNNRGSGTPGRRQQQENLDEIRVVYDGQQETNL